MTAYGDNDTPAAAIENLSFRWQDGDPDVLAIVQLTVGAGERVFIEGPSGSGKTTLLNLLTGVVTPTEFEEAEDHAF